MKQIDARGYACPMPVLMVKNSLQESPDGLMVLVNTEAAKENISRYAVSNSYTIQIDKSINGEYHIAIEKM